METIIRSGEVTREEWDDIELDTQLPMKAVKVFHLLILGRLINVPFYPFQLCIENRMR